MAEDKEEITLKMALRTLLIDTSLADVKFEGTDGGLVCGNRGLLAARSQVFRSMLFGSFSEARQDSIIRVGYSSPVMTSVVEYCLTDEAGILCRAKTETATNVVALADAANYFDLPKLKHMAEACALSCMEEEPQTACSFLEASQTVECIHSVARTLIQSKPLKTLIENDSVAILSASVLEDILSDEKIEADELTLFRALRSWAEGGSSDMECETRGLVAKEMSRHLSLERIRPSYLCEIVQPSGLVTSYQLQEAFRAQAMEAESQNLAYFSRVRFMPATWQSSQTTVYSCEAGSHVTELLQLQSPIQSGIWSWSVKVEEFCRYAWIGFASTSHSINSDEWLGEQEGGWVYGSNGSACFATGYDGSPYNNIYRTFGRGSVVTMVLDLRGAGTIEASVDDGEPFLCFDNILDSFSDDNGIGFLPAVSLKSPGRVRFLGIEELSSGDERQTPNSSMTYR